METSPLHEHLPRLVVFDLDDTLAESKQPLDEEMAGLLRALLGRTKVAVISGGHMPRFEEQFLPSLGASGEEMQNLVLAPTCASALYLYDTEWKAKYRHTLTDQEKQKITDTFALHVFDKIFTIPEVRWGDIMEDRETMMSFAGLGQHAPIAEKKVWDPDQKKRHVIREAVLPHLDDDFEVRIGGATTIDITRKGIDKGYGIEQIESHVGIPRENMVFIGDALFEGGNDHPVIATGVRTVQVENHHHTKDIIREFLEREVCPECGIA